MADIMTMQNEEVEELKALSGYDVKVMKNMGIYTNVISAYLKNNCDFKLKFQLDCTYPQSKPIIAVIGLDEDKKAELLEILNLELERCNGQKQMYHLLEVVKSWSVESIDETVVKKVNRKQQKNKNSSKSEECSDVSEKLPSMRTAQDVINRFLWDKQLDLESLSVGYTDRFLGLIEKDFNDFSWDDIASVDYDTLAIPKHRIQYFKYHKRTVWDKRKRLDNVFGSTGSGIKILESHENITDQPTAQDSCDSQLVIELDSDNEETDSDVVKDAIRDGADAIARKEGYWGPKKRPTHFLCVRLSDEEIIASVKKVQMEMINLNANYTDCMVPPDKLHVTIACVGLDSDDKLSKAKGELTRITGELADSCNPASIRLKFRGIEQFYRKVIYSPVERNEEFIIFTELFQCKLAESGIEIRDVYEFNPHMTIMKMKGAHQREQRTRYIDDRFLQLFKAVDFGSQLVSNVFLCEMSNSTDDKGFYISHFSKQY